jgi:hypothetical protein
MSRTRNKHKRTLEEKYPPSEPCACQVCLGFCARPGWWSVAEAAIAMEAGFANRMMLEMSPERTFGVLSPAFKGNEGAFSRQEFADQGCTFLVDGRCELHGTGLQPLECRFCHHDRQGGGALCHADLEKDWATPDGQSLVVKWSRLTGFLDRLKEGGFG